MSYDSFFDDHEETDLGQALCMSSTQMAVQVLLTGDEVWIPRSVLGDYNELEKKGDRGRLTVASWFAEKEGLE